MVVVGVLIVEGLKAAGAASVVLQTTWVPRSEGIVWLLDIAHFGAAHIFHLF